MISDMAGKPVFAYVRQISQPAVVNSNWANHRGVAMSQANEPSNIVNLSQRLDPSSGRGGDLLNAVRSIATRRLQQYIGNMFEHVDDALFDLAEKAENNAAQMHYFDGMREVRKRRPVIERSFLAQVSRELNDFVSGHRSTPQGNTPAPLAGSIELSLVADNELEESLAITSMIGKNETRLTRDLFAVNQRLSVICGGVKIDDASNPIGPALLAQAFRQSMRELSADMRVKLIIYKLFDRYVMASLDELYQETNAELMRAGVLPQLRHEVVRQGGASAGAAGGAAGAAGGDVSAPIAADDSEASAELLQTLRTLFGARRAHPNVPLSAIAQGPLPTANELIGALSVLQSQAATVPVAPIVTTGASTLDITQQVLQLKEQLLSQLGSLRGQRPGQIATMDEDTIDLVGMLFEFILEDRNLPPQMQVMLARLQIPYLKAAILDRKLFAHRQHPARRLLDGLADAAKSWSEESDRDGRLHDTIKAIVERLLQEFDDDMTIFDRLFAELQQFQEANRRRAARGRIHPRPREAGTGTSPRRTRNSQSHRRSRIAAADPWRAVARLGELPGADDSAQGRGVHRVPRSAALRRCLYRQHQAGAHGGSQARSAPVAAGHRARLAQRFG
jgi:hypothetical protein